MILSPVNIAIAGVIGLLGVGFYALLFRRNLIKLVIGLQILVKGVMLGLIVAGSVSSRINLAQSMVINVIVADTIVAVIGMALAVQVRRQLGTLDVAELSKLRG
jgi:NADH-quinone oxidoreductase subunit K